MSGFAATLLGIVFVTVPVILGICAVRLLSRLRGSQGIAQSLVNLILHPQRLRRFLIEVSVMAGVLVAGLVIGGVTLLVTLPDALEEGLLGAISLLGTLVVLVMTLEGLRNSEVTLGDELVLRDSNPALLATFSDLTARPGPRTIEGANGDAMYVPPTDWSSNLEPEFEPGLLPFGTPGSLPRR